VPSTFRILNQLLARLEDQQTGEIIPSDFHVQIPPQRMQQANDAAGILGESIYAKFPFVSGAKPVSDDLATLVLNRTWRPELAVIGIDGLPAPGNAGNVMLPYTTAKLSLRLPPTLDGAKAASAIKPLLESDPPYRSKVEFTGSDSATGWNAPALSPWLEQSVVRASREAFNADPGYMGEGGTIPFMAMLGEKFPKTQFVVTGVLGPHSNAHGPNEFLHIPTGKRVTMAIARIIVDQFAAGA
jgi:acetylornithine deacetylase/succinyl-diaminopimelate desuccinylase-like protein